MVHRMEQIEDPFLAGESTDEEHERRPDRELRETLNPVSRVILLRVHAVVDHGHLRCRNWIRFLDVRLHVPGDGNHRVTS